MYSEAQKEQGWTRGTKTFKNLGTKWLVEDKRKVCG